MEHNKNIGSVVTKTLMDRRGEINAFHIDVNRTIGTSNIGTTSGVELGAAGSGTESLLISNTLASRGNNLDRMFAIHEVSFYHGALFVGSAHIRGASFSGTQTDWEIETYLDLEDSDSRNLVAKSFIKNLDNAVQTASFKGQWRLLQPATGGTQ